MDDFGNYYGEVFEDDFLVKDPQITSKLNQRISDLAKLQSTIQDQTSFLQYYIITLSQSFLASLKKRETHYKNLLSSTNYNEKTLNAANAHFSLSIPFQSLTKTISDYFTQNIKQTFTIDEEVVNILKAESSTKLIEVLENQYNILLGGHTSCVNHVAFIPKTNYIVSCSDDSTIRIWDYSLNKLEAILRGHKSVVWNVCGSDSGEFIASASADTTVRIWHLKTKSQLYCLEGHTDEVNVVCFVKDEKVISGSDDSTVRIWDIHTFSDPTIIQYESGILYLSVTKNYNFIVSACKDYKVYVYNTLVKSIEFVLDSHSGWIRSVALSADESVIVTGSYDHNINVYSFKERRLLMAFDTESSVCSVTITNDQNSIIAGCSNKTVQLWNIPSQTKICSLSSHTGRVKSAQMFPNSQSIISCSDDGDIIIWDANTYEKKVNYFYHMGDIRVIRATPDYKNIFTYGNEGVLKMWSIDKKAELVNLGYCQSVDNISIVKESKFMLVIGSDYKYYVWKMPEAIKKTLDDN
ncbi:hypothetical protein SteCoe_10800 [Stentor coeruleus]|uniref:Uncharacterized protein n=1 Tax=Stentor coeruleus TaxID=5963 RepID=A0A1R2CEM9_9CILI|nr:hypothetical protein SteCoe_10800 [Stentor coeruleus]